MFDLTAFSPSRVFVIAEAGCNHNGDFALAERLVDAAAETGADAVKFQAFRAECMITRQAPKAEYQIRATGTAESQYDRLVRMQLDRDQLASLKARAEARGLLFCASAFDEPSLDLLVELGSPFIKIPSGEITNLPLLRRTGAAGLPVILSTGMADEAEIGRALEALAGARQVMLLHCVSAYPSDWSEANLRAIPALAARFGLPVGFSDHSQDDRLAIAAVALGAACVEKHITLDRGMEGGDHLASLEPGDFGRMVAAIRALGPALGDGVVRCMPSEKNVRAVARKSLVAARPIARGQVLRKSDLACKRPGTGISPAQSHELVGRIAARDIAPDEILAWADLV
ncbi:MAG: N-acetylneuraminate synthase family protein [Desulfovibrionaceae bacterium]